MSAPTIGSLLGDIEDEYERIETPQATTRPWPTLHDDALYGLAGDVVRTLEPETESDPAALLFSLLVSFGSAINRTPYAQVRATKHYTNLNVCIVGRTGEGRKGHSLDEIRALMHAVDPTWTENCMTNGGASSGEGLLFRVRDPQDAPAPDATGKQAKPDPGVTDKRLLVVEPEFASVLRVCARDGNTLSAVLRSLYDSGTYGNMVKHNPVKTTNAHVSILGHITPEELASELTKTDAANGFANRFLFALVRRSKLLPEGGEPVDVAPLVKRLSSALMHARRVGRVERDAGAKQLWAHEYEQLVTTHADGLLGAVMARGVPNVLRLSVIYALLDESPVINSNHLKAAIGVWRYCEESASIVFGQKLGNPTADAILKHLREIHPEVASRAELSAYLGRHKSASEIDEALEILIQNGTAERVRKNAKEREGKGRPPELWRAIQVLPSLLSLNYTPNTSPHESNGSHNQAKQPLTDPLNQQTPAKEAKEAKEIEEDKEEETEENLFLTDIVDIPDIDHEW
jgi:hypothetical protein